MNDVDILNEPSGYKKISANTVIVNDGFSDSEKTYIILSGRAAVYKDFNTP